MIAGKALLSSTPVYTFTAYKVDYIIVYLILFCISTMLVRNYRDKREKRCCCGSHKQCKTLFKDHMVRFKIISLYIYKDLRLKTEDLRHTLPLSLG